ncbi:Ig-like domain-containing protein [Archangium sp.]|uniref:Ig-like domain-containing protein n=1 Tax=Archangium sp. TaxID=1872627 RepID=UPI003899A1E0
MRFNKASLWLSALLMLGGCDNPKLSAITVTCDPASVVAGQSSQCTTSATDQDGKPFAVSGYTWNSSNGAVATVDSAGKATSLTSGTTTISASATADGVTQQGQATLTVTPQPPRLSAVTVTCDPTSVPATRPAQCTASATDQYGKPFTVSSYTWTSSNESVATVGSTGKVTTFTAGPATLRASATADGVTQQGQASLTVTAEQPTLHSSPITANETWRETENPHVVQGALEVGNASAAPTLTLSAGTMVRFKSGASLRVGQTNPGGLSVDGTAAAPVLLTADSASPQPGHWQGVHIVYYASSPSHISHATIEYAGAVASGLEGTGNLNLYGEFVDLGPGTRLDHVVVRKSSQQGLYLGDGGNIGSGSTGLVVRENGGYAISANANFIGTIPADTAVSVNARDAVEALPNMYDPQTWPNLGIPYVVNVLIDVGGKLTLLPGTELRFAADTGLNVGADEGFPGAVIAMGTAQAPIRFVPDAATPTPGYWHGLHFWHAGESRLDHVTVTHAGAASTIGTGNVNVFREIGAFVTNSTLSNSAGCGITRSTGSRPNDTQVTTDFTLATYNNTFANNTGGAQCDN